MNAELITQDVIKKLQRRYGVARQIGHGHVYAFGSEVVCSVNYSKLLAKHKYFYAVPRDMLVQPSVLPASEQGNFVLLICGSSDKVLILPHALVLRMLNGVSLQRVDIFYEDGNYVMQTTKHPKLDVTEHLNAFPDSARPAKPERDASEESKPDRVHVRMQWSLITLGIAEGCSVWVPVNDRNLAYKGNAFTDHTLSRLPNFGFEEMTRRIVQNIDVLWINRNVIRRAFEVESTTSIYSGLLRLNDLVLAQPNTRIDLFVAADSRKRPRCISSSSDLPSNLFCRFAISYRLSPLTSR